MFEWLRRMSQEGCLHDVGGDGRNHLAFENIAMMPDGPYFTGIGRNANPDLLGGDKIFEVMSIEPFPVVQEGMQTRVAAVNHSMAKLMKVYFTSCAYYRKSVGH